MTSTPSAPSTPSTPDLRRTVERFWAAAEERDWAAFAGTLAEDVLY